MEWFNDFKDVQKARREASPETRFQAFTLTNTAGQDIQAEINRVKEATVTAGEEEKKE